uniref:Uncharacterized protein n=1 Tax=Oryza nivara TaxID=4536 RepID=A0A0E0G514_ORYNI
MADRRNNVDGDEGWDATALLCECGRKKKKRAVDAHHPTVGKDALSYRPFHAGAASSPLSRLDSLLTPSHQSVLSATRKRDEGKSTRRPPPHPHLAAAAAAARSPASFAGDRRTDPFRSPAPPLPCRGLGLPPLVPPASPHRRATRSARFPGIPSSWLARPERNGRFLLRSSAWLTRCKVDAARVQALHQCVHHPLTSSLSFSSSHSQLLSSSPLSLAAAATKSPAVTARLASSPVVDWQLTSSSLSRPQWRSYCRYYIPCHLHRVDALPLFSVATTAFSDRQATRSGDHGGVEQLGAPMKQVNDEIEEKSRGARMSDQDERPARSMVLAGDRGAGNGWRR